MVGTAETYRQMILKMMIKTPVKMLAIPRAKQRTMERMPSLRS